MLNDASTPLSLLATRRSGKPRDLIAPGPSPSELAQILKIAARVPDHGKLAPWRFVVIEDRDALSELLVREWRSERGSDLDPAPLDEFARQAPVLVVVLFSPVVDSKIPHWEQQLSCGAACMTLLNAVHALGFAGGWLTGWAAQSDAVRDAFGAAPERIAGYFFLGTPAKPLEERVRPEMDTIVRKWPKA